MRGRVMGSVSLSLSLMVLSCAGNGPERPDQPGDAPGGILLLSIEAFRTDVLSIYGADSELPGLERLASLGTVFEDAATVCPMARPSAATLLTGVAPDRSGVRNDTSDRLPAGITTLAERFKERGDATVGIVGTPFCSYSSGLDRGFELFDGPEEILGGPERHFPPVTAAGELAGRFGEWLGAQEPERRFFAWVHLSDLHGLATREDEVEGSRTVYTQALAGVDAAVTAILDSLETAGRLDSTAIVLVGTHGVLLGENGARGGSYWLSDETLRVPMVVKNAKGGAGFEAGSRSAAPAWLPDVAATVAALGRIEPGAGSEGIALEPATEALGDRIRVAWTWATDDETAWPTLTAVDDGAGWSSFGWDALSGGEGEPGSDPSGSIAIARSRPARPRARELPAELRSRLETEGIVTSWVEKGPPLPPGTERNALLADLQLVRHRVADRGSGQRTIIRRLENTHPENMATLTHRIYLILRARMGKPARRLGTEALELYPERSEVLHWAGHAAILGKESDPARGELLLEAAASLVPGDPDLVYDLACTRARAGDADGALARLEQALDGGFRNWAHIERDRDLDSIRGDPRYARILASHGR